MENSVTSAWIPRTLGVSRVDDLPASKMGELFNLVDKMPAAERQSLFSGVKDFPRLIEKAIEGFKDNAKHAFMGNEASMHQFSEACKSVLAVLHDMVREEELSQLSERDIMEYRRDIINQMLKILQMMKEKDTENKEFIAKIHEKGDRSSLSALEIAALITTGAVLGGAAAYALTRDGSTSETDEKGFMDTELDEVY